MKPSDLLAAARTRTPLFWWRFFLGAAAAAFSLLLILQPSPWRVLAEAGRMENFTLNQTIYFWTWWAGVGSIVIAVGLCWLAPWWAGAPAPDVPAAPQPPAPRWFWPLTLGAIVACGALAGPTLNHSLWDDENESLTYYSLGRFQANEKTGRLRFKDLHPRRTVFGFSTPNNHVFHNILSRASNQVWRALVKPRGLQFNHYAVRLPAFVAALFAVAAMALLLKEFGSPAAGVAAAWFLAVHPWFTEHAAVARGYSLFMLLALLAVMAWRRALTSGRWLWWVAFATAQFFMMWNHMGSFFLLALLNLAALVLILTRSTPSPQIPVRTQLSKWFCVNSMVAAGLMPLLLPLVAQLRGYTKTNNGIHIGSEWIRDVTWFFIGGAPWTRHSDAGSGHQDMQLVAQSLGAWAPWMTTTLVGLFFLAGVWVLARRGKLAFALAVCVIAAPVLQFFYARMETVHIWHWYVIYALPFVAMFWGLGVAASAERISRAVHRPWLAPAFAASLLATLVFLNHPVHAWQLVHSKTPLRESVLATRPHPGDYRAPANRNILTMALTAPVYAYDPYLLRVRSAAEIILLCRQADREGRPLSANLGHRHEIQIYHQREFALLQDQRLFGRAETFRGAEEVWDRYVFHYTPGAVSRIDLAEFLDADEIAFVEQYAAVPPEKFFAAKVRPAPGGGTTSGSR
jgi:hypothetical protein